MRAFLTEAIGTRAPAAAAPPPPSSSDSKSPVTDSAFADAAAAARQPPVLLSGRPAAPRRQPSLLGRIAAVSGLGAGAGGAGSGGMLGGWGSGAGFTAAAAAAAAHEPDNEEDALDEHDPLLRDDTLGAASSSSSDRSRLPANTVDTPIAAVMIGRICRYHGTFSSWLNRQTEVALPKNARNRRELNCLCLLIDLLLEEGVPYTRPSIELLVRRIAALHLVCCGKGWEVAEQLEGDDVNSLLPRDTLRAALRDAAVVNKLSSAGRSDGKRQSGGGSGSGGAGAAAGGWGAGGGGGGRGGGRGRGFGRGRGGHGGGGGAGGGAAAAPGAGGGRGGADAAGNGRGGAAPHA